MKILLSICIWGICISFGISQEVYYSKNMKAYMPSYSDPTKIDQIIADRLFSVNSRDFKKIKPYGRYKKISLAPYTIMSYTPQLRTKRWADYYQENGNKPVPPMYLYKAAYTCIGGSASDTAKVVLFFSEINLDKNKGKTKEVLKTLEESEIVLREMVLVENPRKVNIYSNSDIKEEVYPLMVYSYDLTSISPRTAQKPSPHTILRTFGRLNDYFTDHFYQESTEIKYNKNKIESATDLFFTDSGKKMNFSRTITYNLETGKEESIYFSILPFNTTIGVDLKSNKLFIKENYDVDLLLGKEGKDIRLINDIEKIMDKSQFLNEDGIIDFLKNFKNQNEMIFNNPLDVAEKKDTYVYLGPFKNNMPNGWGLMYRQNRYEPAFYFGEFKNGIPDGFGFRSGIALPEDSIIQNPKKLNYGNSPYMSEYFGSAGLHQGNKLLYGILRSNAIALNGGNNITYRSSYGDFRAGKLNGEAIECFISLNVNGNAYHTYYMGTMKDGFLHGNGAFRHPNGSKIGIFENGNFISGATEINRIHYEIGRVIRIDGKKYVIMSKNTTANTFLLDNGNTISSKDPRIEFVYQMSLYKDKACQVCNGSGWITESWSNTYAGSTQTQKTYSTGPTGYILWEKTTTTTTTPLTVNSSRTKKCGCGGIVRYKGPKPLLESER